MRKVLTVAGSDSGGGAGIQADLKTFSALGVFGMSAITAVTAQNTLGVSAVQDISPDIIAKQIDAVFEDMGADAVKIGMVSQTASIEAIAKQLSKHQARNIVLDPVMISKSGFDLLQPEAKEALIKHLLPIATIITPNIHEAQAITGCKIINVEQMEFAAREIYSLGPQTVLVKGGHLEDDAVDVLYDGKGMKHFQAARVDSKNTHGTGCTLSSAIAANLALGDAITEAVEKAKNYITEAIKHSFPIGKGVGPVHHFYRLYQKAGF